MRYASGGLQLFHSHAELLALRRAIMPQHCVLHKAHALPLYRVGDDTGGTSLSDGQSVESGFDLPEIVTIDLSRFPAECLPFCSKRLQGERMFHAVEAL